MTLHLLNFVSLLLAGVTHIPRLRDPPGFWENVERNRGGTDPWAWQKESGIDWWLVCFALAGLMYIAFWSWRLLRSRREKRARRRLRTIHPIAEPEPLEQRFKRYK